MTENKKVNFISWLIVGVFVFFGLVVAGIFIWLAVVMPTPPNNTNYRLFSMNKTQCISVITDGKIRYFINGEHKTVPKSGYVKVNIREIEKIGYDIGDEIGICWKKGKYEWEVVNNRSIIIENKLDTLKYKFNTSWEEDERGIPNSKKYHESSCGTFGAYWMKIYDGNNIILEN